MPFVPIELIYTIGLTLGVGSSTFAVIFYIKALQDGVIDASERGFLALVILVLRVGMVLLALGLLGRITFGSEEPLRELYASVLLFIIAGNAILMQYRLMPMRFGPVLAGGTWYALFFVSELGIWSLPVSILLTAYSALLAVFFIIFEWARYRFTPLHSGYRGDVLSDSDTLERYSRDASNFKVTPQAVYYPRSVTDIQELIGLARADRAKGGSASLTLRAGGTCMSGGSLNTGWIVDMTKYMHKVKIDPKTQTAEVEMGAYFRDIEDKAAKHGLMFAAYPSSHRICGIGGMIGNNASGEKSLRCGATSDNVLALEVVLADGTIKQIAPKDAAIVIDQREREVLALNERFGAALKVATGDVKKSASGYRLEKLVENGQFNEIPLFVGAQGTLGIITKATLKLVPVPKHLSLVVISASELENIPDIIKTAFEHNPEGLETFDIHTWQKAKVHLARHADRLTPYLDESAHLFILAQFSEPTAASTEMQANMFMRKLEGKGYHARRVLAKEDVASAWEVRRNSFLLMRDHNENGYRAVPCIEDVIVPLGALGAFISALHQILNRRNIAYGFHGHIGDGSLRIIPVFDFTKAGVEKDIAALMQEVFALVKTLKGNMSADHSDGIIRTPFLKEFYGEELYGAFESVKRIYDPENLMNPNKKVGGTIGFLNQCLDCIVV